MEYLKTKIIIGPTAIGKTKYAIELASKLDAEIISADSMQVYRHMNIGTAKPTKKELSKVKHHFISIINPDELWSLISFTRKACTLLKNKRKSYVVVGGTGLYIRALIYNFQTPELTISPEIRKKLRQKLKDNGLDSLYQTLAQIDSLAAKRISSNDEYRIIRALEVYEQTGESFSKLQKQDYSFAKNFEITCLNTDRNIVYERINQRVDVMLQQGLIDEVQFLLKKGYSKKLNSLKALGYKEVIAYLDGELSLEESIELIKKRTRNFAKRQLTWYRSFPDINWVEV